MIGLHLIVHGCHALSIAFHDFQMFTTITIINRCLEQPFRNAPAPPPHRVTHSNKEASSWTPVHSVLVWPWLIEAAVPWSRSLDLGVKCVSVVNNYLSAGGNRFDLESGPWTIRATCGKETLYQVPIKFAHWRLKSTWFCTVLSRPAGTCVADDGSSSRT